MEPDCSLPHSQVPAICPYPEPHRSSPCPHIPLSGDPYEYYPPIYAWAFQEVSFPQDSPPKPCIHLSSPPILYNATAVNNRKDVWRHRPQNSLLFCHYCQGECKFPNIAGISRHCFSGVYIMKKSGEGVSFGSLNICIKSKVVPVHAMKA